MVVALVSTFPEREPKAEPLPPAKIPPRLSPSSFWASTRRIKRTATMTKKTSNTIPRILIYNSVNSGFPPNRKTPIYKQLSLYFIEQRQLVQYRRTENAARYLFPMYIH
jgi:hypothetical protein